MKHLALLAVLAMAMACSAHPIDMQAPSTDIEFAMEIKAVDPGTSLLKHFTKEVAFASRQRARVETTSWETDDGAVRSELYLSAPTPDDLHETILAAELSPPPGTTLVLGPLDDGGWRTYLLDDHGAIDGRDVQHITDAGGIDDTFTKLHVDLTEDGARRFADLTARSVGDKVAIVIDGEVVVAPIVMSEITGGRIEITARSWRGPDLGTPGA